MDYRRRELLGVLGAGIGLAGCLSRGDRDGTAGPTENTTGDRTVRSQTDPTDDRAADAAQSERSGPPARIAGTTDRILDELAWFASDYPAAIEAYRRAGERVLDRVADAGETVPLTPRAVARLDGEVDRPRSDRGWPYDVWWDGGDQLWRYVPVDWQSPDEAHADATPLSAAEIDRLRDAADAFADTIETELQPHFWGADSESRFATETVDTIEQFSEQGDAAMVVAGLVRLDRHYRTATGAQYVDANLSDDPIRNRLADFLSAPDVEDAPVPPLFEIDYRGRFDHTAFAYSRSVGYGRIEALNRAEPTATIDGSTRDPSGPRLQNVADGVSVGCGRVDRCYLIVSAWTLPASSYYSARLPSETIFLQRYSDADAARTASQRLFGRSGVARLEDTSAVRIGDVDWTPIRFPFDGEPWYAAFRRFGRHLVVAGVARRPLVHRSEATTGRDWMFPLELTWVGSLSSVETGS
jgi:hypothetical protein